MIHPGSLPSPGVYTGGMADFSDDNNCFVCGEKNPVGLRLTFQDDPQARTARAEVVFPAHFQGWRNTVHGGLIATVLDEVMVRAASRSGDKCVTAEIQVKYRKPVATGQPFEAFGRVLEARGRVLLAEGELRDGAGQALVQASAKLFKVV